MERKQKGTIFINYRRDDSGWAAQTLYNELKKYFTPDQLFKDFNAISPGDDFVESIAGALTRCDVLLVLISTKWLDIRDADGKRRLDNPDDLVRLEVAKALARNIKVVPVMLDDAKMPRAEDLPEPLQGLTRRQMVEIDPTRFDDDVHKLAMAIKKILRDCGYQEEDDPTPPRPYPSPKPNPNPPRPEPPIIPQQKPDNNMVWGILTVIFCCQPFGIASIISASKVDTLYKEGKYAEAQAAAVQAKKWAVWAIIAGAIVYGLAIIYAASMNQPQMMDNSGY